MRYFHLLILFCLCAVSQTFSQNTELRKLREEDQAAQRGAANIPRSDNDRAKLVLQLLAQGAAKTPEDKFNAALVLEHTPLTICGERMISYGSYNYLLAHYLAKEAFEGGFKDAGILVAAAIDRYLSFTEGHQKYGTNRIINQKTGAEELVPIDRDVPDSERAKYGVPPLAQLLKMYPEQKRENSTGKK